MKKNCWILVGTLLSTSLLAQPVTNAPATAPLETPPPAPAMTNVTPPPASTNAVPAEPVMAAPTSTESTSAPTNAPAAKSAKKKSKKKSEKKSVAAKKKDASAELKTVPLVAGPAVAAANHVNVRGQPKLKSEVLTRLTNEEPVTVIEEIVRNNSGPEEPSAWAKIVLPAGAHTWINTSFIDSTTKTIKPKKLNIRSGPGENFSVIGQLKKGDTIQEITTKGDWTEIEPPATAYGFVAAQYLRQGGAAPEITSTPPAVIAPTTTNTVAEAPAVATTTTETPPNPVTAPPTNTTAETTAPTNATPETAAAPAITEPPPKRIVMHEGLVRGTISIQAPTSFALVGEDGRLIDYLYTASPDLDLRRYKGLRIVVTGEEAVEERWPSTPIITIQKIQVLSDVSGESH